MSPPAPPPPPPPHPPPRPPHPPGGLHAVFGWLDTRLVVGIGQGSSSTERRIGDQTPGGWAGRVHWLLAELATSATSLIDALQSLGTTPPLPPCTPAACTVVLDVQVLRVVVDLLGIPQPLYPPVCALLRHEWGHSGLWHVCCGGSHGNNQLNAKGIIPRLHRGPDVSSGVGRKGPGHRVGCAVSPVHAQLYPSFSSSRHKTVGISPRVRFPAAAPLPH